jgi:hypothetical protein
MRLTSLAIAFALLLSSSIPARAQASLGGAYIVSLLPNRDLNTEQTILAIPPSGRTQGIVGFLAAGVSRHIGLQAEISVPHHLHTYVESSHPGGVFSDTTDHRDVLLSALLRLRPGRWLDFFVGGGVAFESTTVVHGFTSNDPRSTPSSVERSRSDTRPQFTTGLDLPIPLGRHFALLPTGRVHFISRARVEPFDPSTDLSDDVPLGQPSSWVYRLGLGARIEF